MQTADPSPQKTYAGVTLAMTSCRRFCASARLPPSWDAAGAASSSAIAAPRRIFKVMTTFAWPPSRRIGVSREGGLFLALGRTDLHFLVFKRLAVAPRPADRQLAIDPRPLLQQFRLQVFERPDRAAVQCDDDVARVQTRLL